ncbi:MAG: ferredoxin reductase [Xanthomonadales bacterium]|nr:ferredoxin reductase [Xanthomonadales bacterium]
MTTSAATRSFPARQAAWLFQPLNDIPAWNRLLQHVNPLWSLSEIRARVVARIDEDDETISLWLKPNGRWPGHVAGQHLALGVEINGVLRQRVFSVSSAKRSDGLLRVTLRRQAGGGVTDWLHRHARVDQIVTLSPPGGEFVLPAPAPQKLLMLAGGSGVTPMMAMLGQLADQAYQGSVVLIQLCRHEQDRLFAEELEQLQATLPGLKIIVHESSRDGRLNNTALDDRVPDLADRTALLCGPAAWMADVSEHYADRGLSGQLQQERFAAPRPAATPGAARQINATQSEQVFTQNPGASLLESAETAGLQPAFGCRAGLCRTCLCKKQWGTTRNLITGLRSEQPDEWIQLCISVAESDLELSL